MSLNPLLPSGKRKVNACAIELKNEKQRRANLIVIESDTPDAEQLTPEEEARCSVPLDIPHCDECHMEHDYHTATCSRVDPPEYGHTGRPDPVRDFAAWFAAKPEDHNDNCSCIDCELAAWAGHIPEDSLTLQDPTATFLVGSSYSSTGHKTTSAAYLLKQLRDAIAAGRSFNPPKLTD
tara:strand:+ start:714 stop:1250 length:537 start_codon:yes stop_codon:yes gene_type:complete